MTKTVAVSCGKVTLSFAELECVIYLQVSLPPWERWFSNSLTTQRLLYNTTFTQTHIFTLMEEVAMQHTQQQLNDNLCFSLTEGVHDQALESV